MNIRSRQEGMFFSPITFLKKTIHIYGNSGKMSSFWVIFFLLCFSAQLCSGASGSVRVNPLNIHSSESKNAPHPSAPPERENNSSQKRRTKESSHPDRSLFSGKFRKLWFEGDDFFFKGEIRNNSYILEGGRDMTCFGDKIPFSFPGHFKVQAETIWKKGVQDIYGFSLAGADDRIYVFAVRSDGAAIYMEHTDGKLTDTSKMYPRVARKGDGSTSNLLEAEVNGSSFIYRINGKIFYEGKREGIRGENLARLALTCCGKQKVVIDNIKVYGVGDNGKMRLLLHETFQNRDRGWKPDSLFVKKSFFQDDSYVFQSGKAAVCSHAAIPFAPPRDMEMRLKSRWKNGDDQYYGLILLEDPRNYLTFEVKKDGTSRIIQVHNEKTHVVLDETPTHDTKGENLQKLVFIDDAFRYVVNGITVSGGRMDATRITGVGVMVCGEQEVVFTDFRVYP